MKAGWKSTEFWVVILSTLVSVLVSVHLVPATDSVMLTNAGTSVISAAGVLIANIFLLFRYVKSRHDLKTQELDAPDTVKSVLEEVTQAVIDVRTALEGKREQVQEGLKK